MTSFDRRPSHRRKPPHLRSATQDTWKARAPYDDDESWREPRPPSADPQRDKREEDEWLMDDD